MAMSPEVAGKNANKETPERAYELGESFLYIRRPLEAAAYFISAAERKQPDAQLKIGQMLYHGAADPHTGKTIVPVKKPEALPYLTAAALQGKQMAAVYAGFMLYFGQGVPKDVKAAEQVVNPFKSAHGPTVQWVSEYFREDRQHAATGKGPTGMERLMQAADSGVSEAQVVAAHLFENGLGVPRDLARAQSLYESSRAYRVSPSERGFQPARDPAPAPSLVVAPVPARLVRGVRL